MLIVTEAGKNSVSTARVVEKLARDLKVADVKFIANKVRGEKEEAFIRENFSKDELLGIVHFDEGISEKGMGLGAKFERARQRRARRNFAKKW